MGIVFTPEQVMNGEIPEPGAHEAAGRYILDQFIESRQAMFSMDEPDADTNRKLDLSGGFSGVMVYGSTALGCANIRSDLDVLVTYHGNNADTVLPLIREVFHSAENQFHTKVESNTLYTGALSSPLEHNIDPSFARHLIDVQSQDHPLWSFNWPVSELEYPQSVNEDQVRAMAIRYSSLKTRQFGKAMTTTSGEVNYLMLQRALELPKAIGRKVIAAIYGIETVDQDLLQDQEAIVQLQTDKLMEIHPFFSDKAIEALQTLSDMDNEYSLLLNNVLSGATTIEKYREWLESKYLFSVNLGHKLAFSWTGILKHKTDLRDMDAEIDFFDDSDMNEIAGDDY